MTKFSSAFNDLKLDHSKVGNVSDWITRLQASDSRLHKEDILKQALELASMGENTAMAFLSGITSCYNPFVTWGIKNTESNPGTVTAPTAWHDFFKLLSNLALRSLTGNQARDEVLRVSSLFSESDWRLFCDPILQRDMRCGISDKTINKVCRRTPWEIPVFSCQLATDSKDRPEMSGKKRLEVKLDGVRVLIHVHVTNKVTSVVCYSRNGKIFENFAHIEQQIIAKSKQIANTLNMGRSFVLDGEVVSTNFQALMRQARRKYDVENSDAVFYVFDAMPFDTFDQGHYNMQQGRRLVALRDIQDIINDMPNVRLLDGIEVDLSLSEGQDQFKRYCNDAVEQGFEGVMIKSLDAPYECRRSTFWLKWKPTITVDLEVIELEEGTGKNVGRLGALVCRGSDSGREISVNCGSGFSDDDRIDLWHNRDLVVGSTVEVMCDAVSQNQDGTYSLRFPRFVRFRDDK